MNSRRLIFDVNIVLSAALWRMSVPAQALAAGMSSDLLISEAIAEELRQVFQREKFDKYLSREQRLAFLSDYLQACKPFAIETNFAICRDPKDDKYLELAVSGQAECIITGDEDLLALHPFRGIPILTPKNFLQRLAT